MALTQQQWDNMKEGDILKTPNVRVRYIKNTDESEFTAQFVEIFNKDYKGCIGEVCTNFNKWYEWEIESNIIGGEVRFNPTPTKPHSPNYESLYRDKLSEIQKLQESNKRLKEVIRLLTKEI